jgi:hypothetical protein
MEKACPSRCPAAQRPAPPPPPRRTTMRSLPLSATKTLPAPSTATPSRLFSSPAPLPAQRSAPPPPPRTRPPCGGCRSLRRRHIDSPVHRHAAWVLQLSRAAALPPNGPHHLPLRGKDDDAVFGPVRDDDVARPVHRHAPRALQHVRGRAPKGPEPNTEKWPMPRASALAWPQRQRSRVSLSVRLLCVSPEWCGRSELMFAAVFSLYMAAHGSGDDDPDLGVDLGVEQTL